MQRNGEWGVGFVQLCGVWQSVYRSCVSARLPWLPPPPTYFADDRSRVKFSLLEQGPFSGLLQVWRIPVSRTPSSNAHPHAWVLPRLFPILAQSLLPGSCAAPPVTAAVTLCGQEGTVGTEDVSCLTPGALPSLGCPHFPPAVLSPLSLPPDLLSFCSFLGLSWPPGLMGYLCHPLQQESDILVPTQGCSSSREYLAVQGPDKLTMEDFWTLVWEQDVHTILTLLPWQEKGEVRHHACLRHGRAGTCLTAGS